MRDTVISVCDYSGTWPLPFAQRGYRVVLIDPKHPAGITRGGAVTRYGMTAREFLQHHAGQYAGRTLGVLMAPVCTHFTVSANRLWKIKDADGRTAEGVALVRDCLGIRDAVAPDFWALENPAGRLPTLVPELGRPYYFNPCDFAGYVEESALTLEQIGDDITLMMASNRYTKKTGIWGNAEKPEPRPMEPYRFSKQGSWTQLLGGKSERTKELRSTTPLGFSRAFCLANLPREFTLRIQGVPAVVTV